MEEMFLSRINDILDAFCDMRGIMAGLICNVFVYLCVC